MLRKMYWLRWDHFLNVRYNSSYPQLPYLRNQSLKEHYCFYIQKQTSFASLFIMTFKLSFVYFFILAWSKLSFTLGVDLTWKYVVYERYFCQDDCKSIIILKRYTITPITKISSANFFCDSFHLSPSFHRTHQSYFLRFKPSGSILVLWRLCLRCRSFFVTLLFREERLQIMTMTKTTTRTIIIIFFLH